MYAPTIRTLALIFVLTVGWGEPAQAQDSDNAAAISAAQQHFDDGVAAYQDEDFEQTLEKFSQAHAEVPAAIFLYNAARVAEKLERFDESLKLAELAQAEVERPLPDVLVEKNTALIRSLRQRIAQADAEAEKNRFEAVKFADPSHPTPQSQPVAPAPRPPAPTDEGGSALSYSGAGIAILGLGLIGTSIYLATDANAQIDALETIEDPKDFNRRIDEIDAQQFTGNMLLYSGIATVAAGGALIAWDLLTPTERPTSEVSPTEPASITGASISLSPDATHVGIRIRGVY